MIKHCDVGREEQVAEMIEPLGLEKLREAIAAYVLRRRSMARQNVCIFGSKQLRLELIRRLLLDQAI
jgi:DNA-binding transcriptional MocR family regulator